MPVTYRTLSPAWYGPSFTGNFKSGFPTWSLSLVARPGMLAHILFLIYFSPCFRLARKLTDAYGTRRQSNLLKLNADRLIRPKNL
jgi:hypothetical protein